MFWRCRLDRQRMHPFLQFGRQNVVNHPMLLDPGFALKRCRDNFDAKMAFPVGPGSRMALVLRRFINHLQGKGCKRRLQLGLQGFSNQS